MSSLTLLPILPQKFVSLPQIAPQILAPKIRQGLPENPGRIRVRKSLWLARILARNSARNFGHPNVRNCDLRVSKIWGKNFREKFGQNFGRVFGQAAWNFLREFVQEFRAGPLKFGAGIWGAISEQATYRNLPVAWKNDRNYEADIRPTGVKQIIKTPNSRKCGKK